jgi:hypothetical protein
MCVKKKYNGGLSWVLLGFAWFLIYKVIIFGFKRGGHDGAATTSSELHCEEKSSG